MKQRNFVCDAILFGINLHIIGSSSEVVGGGQPDEVSEYCQWEYLNASCTDPDDVILMRSAFYGRMRFGRCVRENHGAVGCGADVLSHLDRKCSGRKACQLTIPDATLHNIHPCPKELMPYLEASYSCVKVKSWVNQNCGRTDDDASKVSESETPESGILLPPTFADLPAPSCPWVVRTKPGRRINLTVFSFAAAAAASSENGGSAHSACATKILIVEGNKTTTAELCAADGQRQRRIYASTGHLLRVYVQPGRAREAKKMAAPTGMFLLSYQAFDCADIGGLSNAWVRRSDDKIVVRCNFTAETFFLTCRNSRWIGELYNCSDRGHMAGYHSSSLHTYGVLAVIGLGVSLGVATAVVLLFSLIVCFRKRQHGKQRLTILPPTSYPLLSGTGVSDHLDVQSIYLSDCRAFRHPDHVCPVDICAHNKHHGHWEPIYMDPSGGHHHHHHHHHLHPSTGLPSPSFPSTQSTSTSPTSLGREYRSPVSRQRQLDDVRPECEERGGGGGGGEALRSRPLSEVSRGFEGRYSDRGSQNITAAAATRETRTFDLVKDFVRPLSLPHDDDDGGQLHRRHHLHHPDQLQSVIRRSPIGDPKLPLHHNDGGGQHPDNCPRCPPRRAHEDTVGTSRSPPRGTLTRVRLSTTTAPSDAAGNALSVT